MSNSKYLEKFRSHIQVFEHLGGEPGCTSQQVKDKLIAVGTTPDRASDTQINTAKHEARGKYLANLFLMNSHPRFAVFVAKLKADSIMKKQRETNIPKQSRKLLSTFKLGTNYSR
mmetsp:Transcript_22819/g.34571  ORF Transcript_22819/g.34571 Transcript_22819/m.34571 type:complete len:115 (-) Transcript_22819:306-650(-)